MGNWSGVIQPARGGYVRGLLRAPGRLSDMEPEPMRMFLEEGSLCMEIKTALFSCT